MKNEAIKTILQLSKREKLLLLNSLWDSIATVPGTADLHEPPKMISEEKLKTFADSKLFSSNKGKLKEK